MSKTITLYIVRFSRHTDGVLHLDEIEATETKKQIRIPVDNRGHYDVIRMVDFAKHPTRTTQFLYAQGYAYTAEKAVEIRLRTSESVLRQAQQRIASCEIDLEGLRALKATLKEESGK